MSLAAAYVIGTKVQASSTPRDRDPRFEADGSHRLRRTVEEELQHLQAHADRFTPELEGLYDAARRQRVRQGALRLAGGGLVLFTLLAAIRLGEAGAPEGPEILVESGLLAAPLVLLLAIVRRAAFAETVDRALGAALLVQFGVVGWAVLVNGTTTSVAGDPRLLEMAILLGAASLAGLPRPLARFVFGGGLALSLAFGLSAVGDPWQGVRIALGLAALTGLAALAQHRLDRTGRESFLARLRSELQLRQSEDDRAAMEQLARLDPLTGIANRRAFDIELAAAASRAEASGDAVLLALVDVDHFKAFNDREGHVAGDECLRRVAAVLRAQRGDGFVARYGGEEFAMVLSGPGREELERRIDGLCAAVAALRTLHRGRTDGIDHVTVSVGCASAAPGEALGDTIARADAALYRAKAAGRNCRVMDDDPAHRGALALRGLLEAGLAHSDHAASTARPTRDAAPISRRRAR